MKSGEGLIILLMLLKRDALIRYEAIRFPVRGLTLDPRTLGGSIIRD